MQFLLSSEEEKPYSSAVVGKKKKKLPFLRESFMWNQQRNVLFIPLAY